MSIYQSETGDWIYFDGLVKHAGLTESEAWIMSREQDFITAVRAANRQLWDGYHALRAMQDEWSALDYGTNLDDGEGPNAGILAADVGAVVFATADEIKLRIFDTGHATNLAHLL